MRKLATIRTVHEIQPIPDADMIELPVVSGQVRRVNSGKLTPSVESKLSQHRSHTSSVDGDCDSDRRHRRFETPPLCHAALH